MSHWTRFAGLAAPDPGESTEVLNSDFVYRNPDLIDQFLQVGAVSHRHDGHAALVLPQTPVTLTTVGSAGTLPNGTTYYVSYTTVDARGGETAGSPPGQVTTVAGIQPASAGPSASADYSGGIMPAGNYAYAVTYTDGGGGETNLGPTTWVYLDPGHASAQVILSGLSEGLIGHGGTAVNWRLWRSYEGEDWHLVTQGSTDLFTDAGFDPPDNPARPPDVTDNEAGANAIIVRLPAVDSSYVNAASINVYLSTDPGLASPSYYTTLPIACAGATFVITTDTVNYGQPPEVTTSIAGAGRIFPDTDLIFGLKSSVPTTGDLPSGAIGDVRMVEDSDTLYALTPSGWVSVSGPGTWQDPVANPASLPKDPGNIAGDARVTLSTMEIWLWGGGGGLDRSFIPAPSAAPSAITAGDTGVTCLTSDDTYIYWTWSTGPAHNEWGAIGRAKLDGTDVEPFFIYMGSASGIVNPTGIAVDSSHVYWNQNGFICRANLDGTSPTIGFAAVGAFLGLAVDDNYLYYGAAAGTTSFPPLTIDGIYRVSKSSPGAGTLLHTLGTPGSNTVRDLKVDSQFIYWSDMTLASIGRCALDGSSADDEWVPIGPPGGGTDPNQIVLVGEHLYFGRAFPGAPGQGSGAIGRVKLDGTGLEMDWLDIPPGLHGEWVFGLTYSNSSFYLSLEGIDYPPSSAQTAAIQRYDFGRWELANTAGGGGLTSFIASGGTASARVTTMLDFVGSGAASARVTDLGGGSALVTITVAPTGATGPQGAAGSPGAQGPPGAGVGVGGSAETPLIDPASYIEFVASGGAGVGVTDLGGGSARVSITAGGAGSGGGSASSVVGRAHCSTTNTHNLTANLLTKIPLDTLDFGTMDLPNARFTAPAAGMYLFQGEVSVNAPTLASGTTFYAGLAKNGSLLSIGDRQAQPINPSVYGSVVDDLIPLASGDYVELWVEVNKATSLDNNPGVNGTVNYLTVTQVGSAGNTGPQGAQGAQGAQGVQGAQGPAGPSVGVGGSAATPLIDPASYVEFVASGGASVGVTSLGGGSARVSITAAGTGGATGFVASAGSASATIGPFLGFAGSAGTNVELVQQGTSAIILISASGTQGPQGPQGAQGPAGTSGGGGGSITIAASGGASAVSPDAYIEFDASGGVGLSIASALGGTSAQVLIGAPPDALARVGAGPGTYEVYAAAKFPYAYSQGVDGSLTLDQTGAGTLNTAGSNVVRSSPDGQHIYVGVAVANTNNLVVFRRNPNNTLTSIQTLSIAGTIADLEISPDGQFVYVGATSLTVYQRSVDGTLTLTGASYAGSPAAALAISPNGQFLFAYDSSNVVTSYSRNLLSGALRSVNTLAGLSYPQAGQADLVISPDGLNLYASQGSPNGIRQIAVSGGGTLSSLGNMTTTNNNIGGLVVSPDGNDLYAVSWNTHNVGHYTRSSLTGQLTFVANVTVTNFGVRLAISPDGRFVYGSVVSAQGVVTFSRAQSGGALTVVQQTAPADGASWAAVTVAPTLGAIKPTDLEFVGSAGISVSVSSGSVAGGSAQVVIRPSVGGLVTLSGGTATVSDTSVGANTRILLTAQDNNSTGALRVSARTPGTSFTITSSNAGDSGVVAYQFWGP